MTAPHSSRLYFLKRDSLVGKRDSLVGKRDGLVGKRDGLVGKRDDLKLVRMPIFLALIKAIRFAKLLIFRNSAFFCIPILFFLYPVFILSPYPTLHSKRLLLSLIVFVVEVNRPESPPSFQVAEPQSLDVGLPLGDSRRKVDRIDIGCQPGELIYLNSGS